MGVVALATQASCACFIIINDACSETFCQTSITVHHNHAVGRTIKANSASLDKTAAFGVCTVVLILTLQFINRTEMLMHNTIAVMKL